MAAEVLRVASFNIRTGLGFDGRHSWPFRWGAVADTLLGLDPDLAGLQEAHGFQVRMLGHRLAPWSAHGGGRRDGRWRGERCPVLVRRSRFEVERAEVRWYGDSGHPGSRLPGARFPRVATLVVVRDRPAGARLGVVNTHLDESVRGHRERSLAQLVGWLDGDVPWLVVGDLNLAPHDPALRPLLDAGFADALAGDGGGTFHGWTGRADGPRIDHVLAGPGLRVVAGRVATPTPGGRVPSDHWPVVADVELDGAG